MKTRNPLRSERAARNLVRPALLAAVLCLCAASASGAVRYVDVNSTNATPPYTNWATAAVTIQQAVDAALAGDEIVVTNGTYATGGLAVYGTMTNRVAVDKPLTLRSVNGPELTIIQGYQVPATTNGDGAIRCVYLTNGASLSGFTLTNGATRKWPEASGEMGGGGLWCESATAVASNCVLAGNSADFSGGGVRWGTLNNCRLTGNSAPQGGGAYESTLNNCTLTSNSAANQGGGAHGGTLNHCTLSGNSATGDFGSGGGAYEGELNNCTLTGNSAAYGGGADSCALTNCILTRNSAIGPYWSGTGGGANASTLNNCTLTGNSATGPQGSGGGAFGGTLNNCVLWFNTAAVGENYYGTWMNFCCTTPLPADGTGNLSLNPQLASASHLSASSPCRGAGSAAYVTGTDIDGEPWSAPPSIGCDEYHAGAMTGSLVVAICAAYTNVAVGFPVSLTALIEGRATASVWEFADGVVASNKPYASHGWAAPGDYAVVLRAFNESLPGGVSASVMVHVVTQPVHCVAAGSTNPLPPYLSWATAATNIQNAVDAVAAPGALVLVNDGFYATGGRAVVGTMTNRVVVDKPVTVRSVNGPHFTVIDGGGATRCVYLTNSTSMSGFTLTNGAAQRNWLSGDWVRQGSGGGLWCESASAVASNCVVAGNSASFYGGGAYGGTLNNCMLAGNSAAIGGGTYLGDLRQCMLTGNSAWGEGDLGGGGGGAYASTLNYCVLAGNSARDVGGGSSRSTLNNCTLTTNSARHGGGASESTLNNCTLTGNSATNYGGGAGGSTLNNCIVYFNSAAADGANSDSCELNYCCTTDWVGGGNITNAPLFVDYAGGNLRLQSNSPCINAGNNAYAPGPADLDGSPRIVSGTVDIGAYEFQGPGSVISYAWLQQYGLPTDGSADATDPDADGLNTCQEWRCLTDPTNALSVLRLLSASPAGTNVTVSWESVAGVSYFLERSTNLAATPPFSLLATNLAGQSGTTTYTDTNAVALPGVFYRVGVNPP